MRNQRAEARLAAPAVALLGNRRSVDGEGDLRCERSEGHDALERQVRRSLDDDCALFVFGQGQRHRDGRPVSEPEGRRCCLARGGRAVRPEPCRCFRGERPRARAVGRDDLGGLGAPKHEPHSRAWSDEALGGLDRLLVDATVADGLDEGQACFAQVCLAPRSALLASSEARHAKDDEEEQDRGGTDDHEVVGVAEFLDEPDRRRDHARHREQSDACRRQPRPRISRRLLQLAHRRVEDGRAPSARYASQPRSKMTWWW